MHCTVCDYMCVPERLCESGSVTRLALSARQALAEKQMECGGMHKGIRGI